MNDKNQKRWLMRIGGVFLVLAGFGAEVIVAKLIGLILFVYSFIWPVYKVTVVENDDGKNQRSIDNMNQIQK